ncbi:hypothetical protein NQ015_03340 [Corynebacterium sp. 153RC1]|uniref:hypothetical protein n=1 Tax=unclassified Corynebacterium TaxID=2624378 RepID=UPI00211C57E2|nr:MULTISPECIES: hypothetical protein [unclassified Corynebacterium]MCQ9371297.1 hypothetical protein [Corynebacterium sp. 35RC1]MCQ9351905.1 hypothetical protein [Corynebacterium sp. 209RC1]MCQ9353654.1 hypothetical protein [Corynebacterium sp. 1222RC1]MCQ9356362.1 hypothetical protein [Corynebacterium sp. 122RC1]MCQ9358464.1 hypothetical protein [Corynebacterium sp. 142RC1]
MNSQQTHLSSVSTSPSQGVLEGTHTCYTLGIADPYQGSSWRYVRDETPCDLRSFIMGGRALDRGPGATVFGQRRSA